MKNTNPSVWGAETADNFTPNTETAPAAPNLNFVGNYTDVNPPMEVLTAGPGSDTTGTGSEKPVEIFKVDALGEPATDADAEMDELDRIIRDANLAKQREIAAQADAASAVRKKAALLTKVRETNAAYAMRVEQERGQLERRAYSQNLVDGDRASITVTVNGYATTVSLDDVRQAVATPKNAQSIAFFDTILRAAKLVREVSNQSHMVIEKTFNNPGSSYRPADFVNVLEQNA